jgi:hypothetical protein
MWPDWTPEPWLWSLSDSNRLPPACRAGALPGELKPLGSGRRIRTTTSPLNRRVLYRLSYTGTKRALDVRRGGSTVLITGAARRLRARTGAVEGWLSGTTGGSRTPILWFEARDAPFRYTTVARRALEAHMAVLLENCGTEPRSRTSLACWRRLYRPDGLPRPDSV